MITILICLEFSKKRLPTIMALFLHFDHLIINKATASKGPLKLLFLLFIWI